MSNAIVIPFHDLTFFLSSLFCLSLVGSITGFRLDLIHRDSPGSPLHDPNASSYDLFRQATLRSISRLQHFNSVFVEKSFSSKLKMIVTPIPSEYLMKVGIGTPARELQFLVDTGSDIVWTQCLPCTSCFNQTSPTFDPTKSSTYRKIGCSEPLCKYLQMPCTNDCQYLAAYADKTYTKGILSSDTFTFQDISANTKNIPSIKTGADALTSFEGIGFGCGDNNSKTFSATDGLVGLGGGPMSLISQLGNSINKTFSYCLAPSGSGKLSFGSDALISSSYIKSTPIFRLGDPTYYILYLQEISVGLNRIGIPSGFFDPNNPNGSKLVIDSGTPMNVLAQVVYDLLIQALREAIKHPATNDSGLCYKMETLGDLAEIPNMTFHFYGGADWIVFPENSFVEVFEGVVCLTTWSVASFSIFGSNVQRNMNVNYDLENEKLSFAPAQCNKI
ncbi:hypothetical protein AMTR_s00057p00162890 [Amborella trichopoda]|uniref:Peptidase A1 domain-containing protein n=2 Tax=Amborella trichopoda TaxID=13333 RepID=U5D920_AMBTC|nr:hypothetical protein AMTR_s00057p00162890 [Amborella trichopoda]